MMNPDDRRLLVEGPGDLYFIAELWRKQVGTDAKKTFKIVQQNGKENLIRKLADQNDTIWKRKTMTHLGIVVDADESAERTLQSVADALNRSGHRGLPVTPEPEGVIHVIDGLKIGVWIMPDNHSPGMVEDLFVEFFPVELESQRTFAERTLAQLEADRLHRYNAPRHHSKALTHTVLAWQDEPGAAMGTAILRNYVTPPSEKTPFVRWLARLFDFSGSSKELSA